MKVELKFYNKQIIESGHVMEVKIYELPKSLEYPNGFKYSLIIIDPNTGHRVLMDNHKPKGHHYHLDQIEYNYEFESIKKLLLDFKKLAQEYLGVTL